MGMTMEIELGEKTLAALGALAEALRAAGAGKDRTPPAPGGEWMRMTDICKALSISPPTVRKRVQEGQIEAQYFGERNARYRLRGA